MEKVGAAGGGPSGSDSFMLRHLLSALPVSPVFFDPAETLVCGACSAKRDLITAVFEVYHCLNHTNTHLAACTHTRYNPGSRCFPVCRTGSCNWALRRCRAHFCWEPEQSGRDLRNVTTYHRVMCSHQTKPGFMCETAHICVGQHKEQRSAPNCGRDYLQ